MIIQLYLHLIAYIKYNAIADKEWLNLHRLFIIAERNVITAFSTTDENCYIQKPTTISDLYSYALLLGCAGLHAINVESIISAFNFVVEKANLVSINETSLKKANEIVVDVTTGLAPNFRHFYTSTPQSVFRYLHLEKMLDALDKQRTDTSVFNKRA